MCVGGGRRGRQRKRGHTHMAATCAPRRRSPPQAAARQAYVFRCGGAHPRFLGVPDDALHIAHLARAMAGALGQRPLAFSGFAGVPLPLRRPWAALRVTAEAAKRPQQQAGGRRRSLRPPWLAGGGNGSASPARPLAWTPWSQDPATTTAQQQQQPPPQPPGGPQQKEPGVLEWLRVPRVLYPWDQRCAAAAAAAAACLPACLPLPPQMPAC